MRLFGFYHVIAIYIALLITLFAVYTHYTTSNAAESTLTNTPQEISDILTPRTLGDPDAPVYMMEFASLTCGHCAAFHNDKFKRLKEEYIDRGIVYFELKNFPLNKPALDAALIALCLPKDQYFNFIDFLFTTQDQWAYSGNYLDQLKKKAALTGADISKLDTCLANEDLQKQLLEQVQSEAQHFSIQSTPSFILNNGEKTLSGNQSYAEFVNAITDLLGKSVTQKKD